MNTGGGLEDTGGGLEDTGRELLDTGGGLEESETCSSHAIFLKPSPHDSKRINQIVSMWVESAPA